MNSVGHLVPLMQPQKSVLREAMQFVHEFSISEHLELFMFLSAVAGYYILHMLRLRKHGHHHVKHQDDAKSHIVITDPVELDAALAAACAAGNYSSVVEYWNAFKHCYRAPTVQLSQVVTAMRARKMHAHVIVSELQFFFEKHPAECDASAMNDILQHLAQQLDTELASLVVNMLPSVQLSLDSLSYEILIVMYVRTRKFSDAENLLAEMRARGIHLTPRTVFFALKVSLNMGDLEQALCYFADLKAAWLASGASEPPVPQSILVQLIVLACKNRQMRELMQELQGLPLLGNALDCAASDSNLQNTIIEAAQHCGRSDIVDFLNTENRSHAHATRRTASIREYASHMRRLAGSACEGISRLNAVIAQWVVLVF